MKRFLCLLLIPLALVITNLSATMSIGQKGIPYQSNGVTWQGVKYEDNKNRLEAALPGEPQTLVLNEFKLICSFEGKNEYNIVILTDDDMELPKTMYDCILGFTSSQDSVTIVKAINKKIKYIFDVATFDESEQQNIVMRFVGTKYALYIYRVVGDLSLKDECFNTMNVLK